MRINKYISMAFHCSRRQADRFILEGRVYIDGRKASPGMKVSPESRVALDGEMLSLKETEAVLYAFFKPKGYVCTFSAADRAPTIYDYIGQRYPALTSYLFSIGRLDKDSEGLILLTNRGELVNRVNKASYGHEKEYVVTLEKPVTEEFRSAMARGVAIEVPERKGGSGKESAGHPEKTARKTVTLPAQVDPIDAHTIDIVLTEGLNRQIRRMAAALGNRVENIRRVRIVNIRLEGLGEGELRKIEGEELSFFEAALKPYFEISGKDRDEP